ncbi:hypothetical protein [Sphingobium fluviale]|uniref:UrcA family protein n=1 Tax=Sphingobium fluviale TaxID=2506423 RepID=A0A4Q1KIM8_9SPHN|nr:hypothetical protein [Sphingobium fluviale]RXR29175.1 hypothetical protein EQG66_06685 [Sphingobium fluviale]
MMRFGFFFATVLLAKAGIAVAQVPEGGLTGDQKAYIAYDQCMMQAAMRASRTPAKDEDIFGIAEADCAATRAAVVVGLESNKPFLDSLDAADADKAAKFPAWIRGVRERRAARDAQFARPNNAPNQ